MKKYTVVWQPQAEAELTSIWLESSVRAAVGAASHRIDVELRTNPETKGVVRDDQTRQLQVRPLRVLFNVSDEDRMVRVISVKFVS